MREISMAYGEKQLDLEFPEGFLAGELVRPRPSNEKLTRKEMIQKIDAALEAPQGALRLRELVRGKKVGLVVSDEFRAFEKASGYRKRRGVASGPECAACYYQSATTPAT